MNRYLFIFPLILGLFISSTAEAKKYPFNIDDPREVLITGSATAGFKMVKATAYGRTVDKAINQAMMDAVVALTFFGAPGENEMEATPAILLEKRAAYDGKKEFFDQFFQKGHFLSYVKRINNSYPTGKRNIKTARGRKVQLILLVDWDGLSNYYKNAGLKTVTGLLMNY